MAIQGHEIIQAFTIMIANERIPDSSPECGILSCTYAAQLPEDMGAAEVLSSILLSLVSNLLSSLFKY